MPTNETDVILQAFSRFVREVVREVVRESLKEIEEERSATATDVRPGLLDRRGAAEYLSISVATLDRLRFDGLIDTVTVGRRRKISRDDLDRFIEKQRMQKKPW